MPGHFDAPGPYMGGPESLLFSGLSLLLLLGIPVLLFWAASRPSLTRGSAAGAQSHIEQRNVSAIELLRQRYALGEIDGDTFEQMLERLLNAEVRAARDERVHRLMTGDTSPTYPPQDWFTDDRVG